MSPSCCISTNFTQPSGLLRQSIDLFNFMHNLYTYVYHYTVISANKLRYMHAVHCHYTPTIKKAKSYPLVSNSFRIDTPSMVSGTGASAISMNVGVRSMLRTMSVTLQLIINTQHLSIDSKSTARGVSKLHALLSTFKTVVLTFLFSVFLDQKQRKAP